MFSLFKRTNNSNENILVSELVHEKQTAPGTGITYKKDLVSKYSNDHKELLNLYSSANTALMNNEYEKLKIFLCQLHDALRAHLLDENLNFYIYLQYCYKDDDDNLFLITDYKRDMLSIGRVAFSFLKKYTAVEMDIAKSKDFSDEFKQIGEVLTRRIHAEENYLYPLYRPPVEFS